MSRATVSKYLEDLTPGREPAEFEVFDPAVAKEIRVAIYGPTGIVDFVRTGPNHKNSSISKVFWSEEQKRPMVPAALQRIQSDGLPAFGFFREGCQIKGTMEFYEKCKKIDDTIQRARLRKEKPPKWTNVNDTDIYPDWIRARRRGHSHGRQEVDLKAWLKDQGIEAAEPEKNGARAGK